MSTTRILVLAIASVSLLTGFHPNHAAEEVPPWQEATGWPDRIITTFNGDPATRLAVTWRTDASVGDTIAQIVEATPDARFELNARSERARTQILDLEVMDTDAGLRHSPFNIGLGRTAYHSVTFADLEPDTLYAWRVQGEFGRWSEWFQTRTAARTGPIRFVYFGDAQNGIYSHWSRVIRMAHEHAPDADFFLHAGDLVDKGDSDENWAEWFHAGGFIHARIPSIPVPGNHENVPVWPEDPDAAFNRDTAVGERVRVRSPIWRMQFTLPREEGLPDRLHEDAYIVEYSDDLHIFVVDSAEFEYREQARWLDRALSASEARWKIVTMHHPYFTPPEFDRNARDGERRRALAPVIARHGVDMVLTGHIHHYNRATLAIDDRRASRAVQGENARAVDTVFVISSSGAKMSPLYEGQDVDRFIGDGEADLGDLSLDRVAGNTPLFQVIEIDGDRLTYEARMATGELYDSFTLERQADGVKVLSEGEAAFGETRLFSNTGPYRDWWDLR
ncbi:MAG: metallophosphoesterase family protein [Pseudomonadota bacterium]